MRESPSVLLIEDDPDTRHIYETMLREHGLSVAVAADGATGVRLARELGPRVIVMNLVLPQLDGISATEKIRSDPACAHIPIIVCTAFVREDGYEAAREAGCNVYLEKPVEPSRVVAEVKRFLNGRAEAQATERAGPPGALAPRLRR